MLKDSAADILIKPYDNLKGNSKEKVIGEIRKKLQGRVISAYLFGSILSENFNLTSDIDLFIIYNTQKSFFDRIEDFSDLRQWLPVIEPLFYTPSEWERLTVTPSPGFWQSVVKNMKRII